MEDNNSLPSEIRDLLHYHKKGTEYIKKALSIDENSTRKEDAINYYKLGIEEFMLGLNVNIDPQNNTRGASIQEKMESNLMMAIERVDELEKLNNTQVSRFNAVRQQIEKTRKQRSTAGAAGTSNNSKNNYNYNPITTTSAAAANAKKATKDLENKLSSLTFRSATQQPSATSRPNSGPSTNIINRNINNVKKPSAAVNRNSTNTSNPNAANSSTPNSKVSLSKKLKIPNVEEKLVEFIMDEIVDHGQNVKFSDIAGQSKAKQALNELVILPALNPELFTGLRSPVKGLLLFGPPGNGKTMLAKAVANEANCNFFNITAASLTSKYVGEGEKLVRALFSIALYIQPSIIFIDEIDSLLFERKENDHEASRRLKTEFLTQFDGMQSNSQDRILVMGATNRPYELDNAALRRFPKRIYIGLPDFETRVSMVNKLLESQSHSLRPSQIEELAFLSDGYSGSDLTALAKDAALGPIREQSVEQLKVLTANKIRPLNINDFKASLNKIRQSTPKEGLSDLEKWNREYGDINA